MRVGAALVIFTTSGNIVDYPSQSHAQATVKTDTANTEHKRQGPAMLSVVGEHDGKATTFGVGVGDNDGTERAERKLPDPVRPPANTLILLANNTHYLNFLSIAGVKQAPGKYKLREWRWCGVMHHPVHNPHT